MSKFTQLIKAVCGLSSKTSLADGTKIPSSVQGWVPVAVVQDRRLCAGVFSRSRKKNKPTYRVLVWRTFRDDKGHEQAVSTLYRDQVDPALSLVALLQSRMPPQ
jgi:hypothetical protein